MVPTDGVHSLRYGGESFFFFHSVFRWRWPPVSPRNEWLRGDAVSEGGDLGAGNAGLSNGEAPVRPCSVSEVLTDQKPFLCTCFQGLSAFLHALRLHWYVFRLRNFLPVIAALCVKIFLTVCVLQGGGQWQALRGRRIREWFFLCFVGWVAIVTGFLWLRHLRPFRSLGRKRWINRYNVCCCVYGLFHYIGSNPIRSFATCVSRSRHPKQSTPSPRKLPLIISSPRSATGPSPDIFLLLAGVCS